MGIFPDIDFRLNMDLPFLPSYTWKSTILGPPKEPRDYLLNYYFAKPDYADSHNKVFYSAYLGAKLAAAHATLEVSSQKVKNPKNAINIVAKNFLFIGGSALLYGTVATVVANIRGKKDDVLNHMIAGGSIGFIAGFTKRSTGVGASVAALGVGFGYLLKLWHLSDRSMTEFMGRREINFVGGSENTDFRTPSWYLNTRDTKIRTERYH